MCYRHAGVTRRIVCPECGAVNVTRLLHCVKCGALLDQDLLEKPAEIKEPPHPPVYQPPKSKG